MSTSLDQAAIASFDTEVKHAYQGRGKLRPSVRIRTGVVGSTHRFPKLGAGAATQRVPQTDVIPLGLQHTNATVTLQDWNAAEYTDVFDQAAVNFDEKSELAESLAKAIQRREDQMIIDALDATASTKAVATSIGGTDTNLNVAKLRRTKKLLMDSEIEEDEMSFVGSPSGQEGMLGEEQATSADYNSVRALVNGEINTFMGFNFNWIGTRSEGGLTVATNVRTNYGYARSAVGMAVGQDARTEINYIPQKTSWLCNILFKANAIEIDPDGVVEVSTNEA